MLCLFVKYRTKQPSVLKTYNTDFGEIIMTFTDKNRMPLEIEDKGNVTFLINICDDIL